MTRPGLDDVRRRFTSPLHDPRTAAILGSALGVAFATCFATGLVSHLAQHPPAGWSFPTRPAGFYRITQGVHVVTGFVAIPLLLAKLWVVFPRLFESWRPLRIAAVLERLSLLLLVGGGLFLLFSGTANVARWYPWPFFFPAAHYAVAWLAIGALAVHVGVKWAITTAELSPRAAARADRAARAVEEDRGDAGHPDVQAVRDDRRRLLAGVGGTAGLLFLATAGSTVSPLSRVSALAQRRPGTGPQGVPVNKSAVGARVSAAALDPDWRLVVRRGSRSVSFSLDDLRALPQHDAVLPIACVEGWSTSAPWRGVRVAELIRRLDDRPFDEVRVVSLQRRGLYRASTLTAAQVADADTLLALELRGEPLHLDHGYPARLIAPNRPGVLQTKWVSQLEVR